MKAAVICENGGPAVLHYCEVPDPECPDGFAVVDAEAISIEGGDLLARAAGQLPAVPHIVGYLSAGTVSEVATDVAGPAVGDGVVALNAAGSHAARRAVPAAMTWPIPAGLDAARAACVPVAFGTAYECLFTAGHLGKGQPSVVAGPVRWLAEGTGIAPGFGWPRPRCGCGHGSADAAKDSAGGAASHSAGRAKAGGADGSVAG
jgi:NADPH2:quinone reductase